MERDALSVELKQGNAPSRTPHPHQSHTSFPLLPSPSVVVAEITRRLEESAKVIQVSSQQACVVVAMLLPTEVTC